MKMKSQGNRIGGLVFFVTGLAMLIGMGIAATFVGIFAPQEIRLTLVASLLSPGLVFLPFTVIGLVTFIQAKKAETIMREGHKSTCTVFNVLTMRNSILVVVTYLGESGTEYRHSLYLTFRQAATVRPGMVIECYIKGEDCYVDPKNLIEVKED